MMAPLLCGSASWLVFWWVGDEGKSEAIVSLDGTGEVQPVLNEPLQPRIAWLHWQSPLESPSRLL